MLSNFLKLSANRNIIRTNFSFDINVTRKSKGVPISFMKPRKYWSNFSEYKVRHVMLFLSQSFYGIISSFKTSEKDLP